MSWKPRGHWCFNKSAAHRELGRKQTTDFLPFPATCDWQVTRWWTQLAPKDPVAVSLGPTGRPATSSLGSSPAHCKSQGKDPGDRYLITVAVALKEFRTIWPFTLLLNYLLPVNSNPWTGLHAHPPPAVPPSQQLPQCPDTRAALGNSGAQPLKGQAGKAVTLTVLGRILSNDFPVSGLSLPLPQGLGTFPEALVTHSAPQHLCTSQSANARVMCAVTSPQLILFVAFLY